MENKVYGEIVDACKMHKKYRVEYWQNTEIP